MDANKFGYGIETTGIVKWWNDSKGFGFITPLDGSEDVFTHWASIRMAGFATLSAGQVVTYVPVVSQRGVQAIYVQVALKVTK